MSDISVAELRNHVDGVNVPPMATFNALKPEVIAKVENVTANPITSESVAMPAMPEKLTGEKLVEYDKSINEVVKHVAIQAKVQSELSKNVDNKAKYNHFVEYALNNHSITERELNAGYQEKMSAIVAENNKEAESVLKEVDNAIELAVAA